MGFLCNDPAFKERRGDLRKNQTDVEKALWSKLRNRQLSGIKFFRQYSIGSYPLNIKDSPLRLRGQEDIKDGGENSLKFQTTKTIRSFHVLPGYVR